MLPLAVASGLVFRLRSDRVRGGAARRAVPADDRDQIEEEAEAERTRPLS